MGKQSRRNRNRDRPPKAPPPPPTPGYDERGIALPPGVPGSLFDVFKLDPWNKGGGFYQYVILPLDPFGNGCREALAEDNQERYRGFMRGALSARGYKQTLAAVHAYDKAVAMGMTDAHAIDQVVRHATGLRLPPYLLGDDDPDEARHVMTAAIKNST